MQHYPVTSTMNCDSFTSHIQILITSWPASSVQDIGFWLLCPFDVTQILICIICLYLWFNNAVCSKNCTALNDRNLINNGFECICKEVVVAPFKVPYQHLCGGTEENHKEHATIAGPLAWI
jgi:hypothetical protein